MFLNNKMIRKSKKGMSMVLDLFIALTIFILVLITIMLLFNFYSNRLQEQVFREDFRDKASMLAEILLSEGDPVNWESTNVEVIGLTNANGQISQSKWDELELVGYDQAKSKFGLAAEDFVIRIGVIEGEFIGTYGLADADLVDKEVVAFNRITSYENQAARLEVKVWRTPIQ